MDRMSVVRVFATLVLLASAVWCGWLLWQYYFYSPWTRDGRVVANVIRMAPQVSGQIDSVNVRENEFVRKGDVLFTIVQEPFQLAVQQAEARVAATQANWQMKLSIYDRMRNLSELAVTEQAQEDARLAAAAAEGEYQQAVAQLAAARLQLQWTEARAKADGWITNINLNAGDYATEGTESVAIVDAGSLRIEAYFEETKLFDIPVGAPVQIYLMAGGPMLTGKVASIARGIADVDNPLGRADLLAVKANYQWIRLAQRIPVRIDFDAVPNGLPLASGMTATVVVMPETEGAAPQGQSEMMPAPAQKVAH
ncbi:efflux RND transporter periplasmic adaptor subunit [Xanthobacter sp. TB0139]|uniref:efflux RND transporter periplasmic adaptor subunit n=1 Tax=Xanthobacter sp. TB0139 TaxID=3459178 RepID=UPI004039BD4F